MRTGVEDIEVEIWVNSVITIQVYVYHHLCWYLRIILWGIIHSSCIENLPERLNVGKTVITLAKHINPTETRLRVCDEVLEQHTDIIWQLAFSPRGHRFASVSQDKTVGLWQWQETTETNYKSSSSQAGPSQGKGGKELLSDVSEQSMVARDMSIDLAFSTGCLSGIARVTADWNFANRKAKRSAGWQLQGKIQGAHSQY